MTVVCRAARNTEGIKLNLQRLILIDASDTKRDMDLSTSIDPSPAPEKSADDSTRAIDIMAPALPAPVNIPNGPLQQAEARLLGSLHECAQAVSALSNALARAIKQVSTSQGHTQGCLQADFRSLQSVYDRMCWLESDVAMYQSEREQLAPRKRGETLNLGEFLNNECTLFQV